MFGLCLHIARSPLGGWFSLWTLAVVRGPNGRLAIVASGGCPWSRWRCSNFGFTSAGGLAGRRPGSAAVPVKPGQGRP